MDTEEGYDISRRALEWIESNDLPKLPYPLRRARSLEPHDRRHLAHPLAEVRNRVGVGSDEQEANTDPEWETSPLESATDQKNPTRPKVVVPELDASTASGTASGAAARPDPSVRPKIQDYQTAELDKLDKKKSTRAPSVSPREEESPDREISFGPKVNPTTEEKKVAEADTMYETSVTQGLARCQYQWQNPL